MMQLVAVLVIGGLLGGMVVGLATQPQGQTFWELSWYAWPGLVGVLLGSTVALWVGLREQWRAARPTPTLWEAIENGTEETFFRLASARAVQARDKNDTTALMVAACTGRTKLLEWLWAKSDPWAKNQRGGCALTFAVRGRQWETVDWMVPRYLDALNDTLQQGRHRKARRERQQLTTVLMHAIRSGNCEAMRRLFRAGLRLEEQDSRSQEPHGVWTCLIAAEQPEMVSILLAHADPHWLSGQARAAYVLMASKGFWPGVDLLGDWVEEPEWCWALDMATPERLPQTRARLEKAQLQHLVSQGITEGAAEPALPMARRSKRI